MFPSKYQVAEINLDGSTEIKQEVKNLKDQNGSVNVQMFKITSAAFSKLNFGN